MIHLYPHSTCTRTPLHLVPSTELTEHRVCRPWDTSVLRSRSGPKTVTEHQQRMSDTRPCVTSDASRDALSPVCNYRTAAAAVAWLLPTDRRVATQCYVACACNHRPITINRSRIRYAILNRRATLVSRRGVIAPLTNSAAIKNHRFLPDPFSQPLIIHPHPHVGLYYDRHCLPCLSSQHAAVSSPSFAQTTDALCASTGLQENTQSPALQSLTHDAVRREMKHRLPLLGDSVTLLPVAYGWPCAS